MKLTTLERLLLLQLLPKEGDITTLRILRDLRMNLSFSEAEHAALQFVNLPDGRMQWRQEGDVARDIEIGDKAKSIIREELERLNSARKLTDDHISIYGKFCDGKD